MPKHTVELNQEIYIEVTDTYRDTKPILKPYVIVKVNITNFYAVAKEHHAEYTSKYTLESQRKCLGFMRLRIETSNLKVTKSNGFGKAYKVWLSEDAYYEHIHANEERCELLRIATQRLNTMSIAELKAFNQK